MLTKDKVRKTIDRLPENFTVDQIVEELVILDKIEEDLKILRKEEFFQQTMLSKNSKHG